MIVFKKIKILSFGLIILFGSVFFANAQNQAVSFSVGPTAVFEEDGGQIRASISGSLNLTNIAIDEVMVVYNVYDSHPGDINDPGIIFTGHFFGDTDPSQNQFTSQNGFFATIGGSSFSPGTEYYFLFRITPITLGSFGQVSTLVTATTPGSPTQGEGNNQAGQNSNPSSGGQTGTQVGDQQQEGSTFAPGQWPQNVVQNNLAVSDLNSFVVGLLNALLKIGIPVLTVFLVYSGLRLVMARGNEKELEDAKKNLLWVIIGGAVLLGAWTIVKVLKGTFDQIDLAFINSLINHVV